MTQTIPPENPEAPTTPGAAAPEIQLPAARASGHDGPGDVPGRAEAAHAQVLRPRSPDAVQEAGVQQGRQAARASTIWDLRDIAKRRTPQAPFDYTDGAAEAEITLRRARQAFLDIEFRPGILRDVSSIDLGTDILGRPSRLPVGIAPTGFTRMMQSEGEYAGSQAAEGRRHPLHPLHHGHGVHRGRCRRRTRRPQLVPAVPVDGPRPLAGTDPTRRRRRATTPSWSPWTPPSPAPACATSATA